jgi:catechol 2,3-dioxygenase-like lactoylglutathione lyase family enzyme
LKITRFTILVEDVDEALQFYTEKLGFIKRKDDTIWVGTRWATVSPKNQPDVQLSFTKADHPIELLAVGKQAPKNPLMFLETDDLNRDYAEMQARGVNFLSHLEEREWGTEVILEDLYGNVFVLVQSPKKDLEQATLNYVVQF